MDDHSGLGEATPQFLGSVPLEPHGIETGFEHRVSALLRAQTPRAVWVYGLAGDGRTTSVAHALRKSFDCTHVIRISCSPTLRIEEALFRLGTALQQAGSEDLAKALEQRTVLLGKLDVLVNTLKTQPVAVWFDDFEQLEAGDGSSASPIPLLLERAASTIDRDAKGRLIITSTQPPPSGVRIAELRAEGLDEDEAQRYVEHEVACVESRPMLPPGLGSVAPLALRLACGFAREERGHLDTKRPLAEIVEYAVAGLTDKELNLLEILVAPGVRIGKTELRHVIQESSDEDQDDKDSWSPVAQTLSRLGLIQSTHETDAWTAEVHSEVARVVRDRAKSRDAEAWSQALSNAANYRLKVGSRSGDLWSFFAARRLEIEAGNHDRATRLNRAYVELFLKWGYTDLASCVLKETVEHSAGEVRAIAYGNLAMIEKNRGNYDEALKIYQDSCRELEAQGDEPNIARVLHQIGNTLYLLDETESALKNYRRSRELSLKLGDTAIAMATTVQIANILWGQGRKEEAVQNYEESLEGLDVETNPALVAAVELQLGQAHLQLKRYVEAEESFDNAARYATNAHDLRSLLKALRAKAVVAKDVLNFEAARRFYTEAETVATDLGDWVEVIDCRAARGDLERQRGKFPEALLAYFRSMTSFEYVQESGVAQPSELQPIQDALGERIKSVESSLDDELVSRLRDEARRTGTLRPPSAAAAS